MSPGLRRLSIGALLAFTLVAAAYGSNWDGELVSFDSEPTEQVQPEVEGPSGQGLVSILWGLAVLIGIIAAVAAIYRGIDLKAVAGMIALGAAVAVFGMFLRPGDAPAEETGGQQQQSGDDVERATGGAIAWWLALAGAGIAAPAAWLVWRSRSNDDVAEDEAGTASDLANVVDQLRSSAADDREAIVFAYSDLEALMMRRGMVRLRSETTNEFFARVATRLGASASEALDLADIYQRAAMGTTDDEVAAGVLAPDRARAAQIMSTFDGASL